MARAGRNVYLVRCLRPFLLLALYLADGCHGIQKFEETPRYTEVNPGQDAKLSCRVSDKRGQCIWQKDNKPIGMLMKKYEWAASPDTGDCSLWIRSAALDFDDGSWQCQVSLSDFTTQDALTSEPARLVVRVSPQRPQIEFREIVVPPGNNVTARAGEVARPLSCVSRYGNPPALLKWYLGDAEVPSLGAQVNTTEETNPRTWAARSFAEILAERRLYGQRIRCVALHAAYGNPGASLGTEVRFDVRYAPETRIVGAPPSGEIHLEEDRDQLAVRCVADANPPAMIRWRREGIVSGGYAGPGNDIAPTAGEALFASPVRRTHAGRYSCVATNTVGESVPIAVHVSVDYPPRISSVGPDRLTTALLYSGASFECLADAVPPPEYRWLQIFADGREPLARGSGHRLLLSNVSYEQQGRYVCLARNEIDGRVREARSEPVSLQVVGAPRVTRPARSESVSVVSAIEGDPARLEITLCSDPRPRLVAWEWGSVRLHAGEILDSRYRALDLEPLATLEDCYAAVLELTTAFKEDQRLYNVVVENDRGSDRCALMLRVTEPGQIPLVVGAVAGFTVLSILIMGFACFLRTDKCCFVRPEEGPGPLQAPPRGNKANVGIADETRSSGVETMERATRRYAQQKQPIDAPLKPHASPQYRQHPPSYDPDHPQQLQQQRQHQRHLHGRQQQIVHGPQCEIQIRRDISTGNEPAILQCPRRLSFAPASSRGDSRARRYTNAPRGFPRPRRTLNAPRAEAAYLPLPPRKATKRAGTALTTRGPRAAKQAKNKTETCISPDLRTVLTGGTLLVFGQGDVGQLGLGENILEKTRPASVPDYHDLIGIAAGGMHNICLTKTGKVLTFGCNDEGALGRDTSKEGAEAVPGFVELPEKIKQVTAGDSHSAALAEDGRVFAWGSFRDSHGNMGLTTRGNEKLPVEILPGVKVVKIASGADHLVILSDKGHVYTCGCGEQGQLGRVASRTADRHNRHGIGPLLTPGLVSFKVTKKLEFQDIWAGTYCTFAKEYHHGDIYVFGLNNYYQIGLGDPTTQFHPQISKTFSGRVWRHISSGQHHTLALDETGQVFAMGRKEYGRLGLGADCSDAKELVAISTLTSYKCIDVAAGSAQSFAVTDAGELYAWGMGSSGQLGTGEEEDVEIPVLVKGKQLEGKNVVRASGGGQHTIALAVSRPAKDKTAG